MAKVKMVILSSRKLKNGENMIYLQISGTGKHIRIATDITVKEENWNGTVIGGRKGDPHAGFKNTQLVALKNSCDLKLINNPKTKKMSLPTLKAYLLGDQSKQSDFYDYTTKIAELYRSMGKLKTSRTMICTRDKILKFHPGISELSEIDVRWLEKFEDYCLKSMTTNGVATYLRYLRIILNRALDDGLIDNYPFRKFKITTEKTLNRNLSIDTIRTIRDYRPSNPRHRITVDIFMLQFYLLGINIKDLFNMKKTNVKNGRLQFNRSKTARLYNIKLIPEARSIIKKYEGEEYLLRFAETAKKSIKPHARKTILQWRDYEGFQKMMNNSLEDIYKILFPKREKITGYYVRHSVATILRELKVSKDDISLVMGHSSPNRVTEIYINEDFGEIDKAQAKLINYLNQNAITKLKEFALCLN